MFKNYLKAALRSMLKYKGFSVINILGLAIGIACSILIFTFVNFEWSYDRFHEKSDRIQRVAVRALIGDTKINQTYSSAMTFKKLLEDFPEIETGVKFLNLGSVPVKIDQRIFYENRVFAVDSTFFDIFTFPLIHGDPKTVFAEPNFMVITESTARKYFGSTNAVGNLITFDDASPEDIRTYQVTGVSEDVPANSHFHYDILVASSSFPEYVNSTGWTNNNFITYLLLKEGTSARALEAKFADFARKYMGGDQFDEWVARGNFWEYYLQAIKSIHLTSDLNGEFEPNGNKTYVMMFLIISIIILLIACINFMNLTTAKSSLRAREVSLRKVVGADRKTLMTQFLNESVFLSFIALAVGILLVQILMPFYRNLMVRELRIHYFENAFVIPALIILGLIVGLVSGSYPAFILSSFRPVAVLKGQAGERKSGLWIRNILIVFQFAISIFLIVGAQTVYKQLRLFQEKKLGFDKANILVVNNPGALGSDVTPFKEVLRNHSGIIDVSGSNTLPGRSFSNIGFRAEDVEEGFTLNICVCDEAFLSTMKLNLIRGRFFSKAFITDSSAVILNQRAVDLLGWEEPLGKRISNYRIPFHIVGVIEDYHYESLHQEVRPMALFLAGGAFDRSQRYISVRYHPGDIEGTLTYIEDAWNDFVPNMPFEYSFLDDDYDNLYINEEQTRQLFTIFSMLAVFIASLGLFGLTSFVVDRKIKEIGIRKVLGATVPGIVGILSVTFTKWIVLANVLAWPAAWFAMNRWLQNFAYRVNIGWFSFLLAGLLALIIALATISFQTVKAAMANPVDALKYE